MDWIRPVTDEARPTWRSLRHRPRVMLVTSGGVSNLGDDAIWLADVQRLRSLCPRVRIGLVTDHTDHRVHLPRGVVHVGSLHAEPIDPSGHDLVIVAGGGWATGEFARQLEQRAALAERAQAAAVPVVMSGIGVGPLVTGSGAASAFARLMRACSAVSLRDPASADAVVELRDHHDLGDATVHVTADDALGLDGDATAAVVALAGTALPARASYAVFHARTAPYGATDLDVLEPWAAAIDAWAADASTAVIGLAVNDQPESPEAITLERLRTGAPGAASWHVLDLTTSPATAVGVLEGATAVVTHSLHVALFAMWAEVPAVLVASSPYYALKADGLRRLARVGDAMVATRAPSPDELGHRLEQLRHELRHASGLPRARIAADAWWRRTVGPLLHPPGP